jgi:hypothetical protein
MGLRSEILSGVLVLTDSHRRYGWTQKMDALLVSLRQEGVPWQEAAVRLGVSLYAAWRRGEKIGQKENNI